MSVLISISLSRKQSRDYNSTAVTAGIETEAESSQDRPGDLLNEIGDLFHLAERAIEQEFRALDLPDPATAPAPAPEHTTANHCGKELCTEKQARFLGQLVRRSKMTQPQLDAYIGSVLGEIKPVARLTKREMSKVIDGLKTEAQTN